MTIVRQKPSVEEWLDWARVVIDRLTDCVRVYKHPPHIDVFMADSEKQNKTDAVIRFLHRIHGLADRAETPTDSISDVHVHDEQTIDGLAVLFREMLNALPQLSGDMQKLLKSPWKNSFPNIPTQTIFIGDGNENHGIGSGHVEDGRLPGALFDLLEREKMGDARHPRAELLLQGEPRRNDTDSRQRWGERNSRSLRSAGRVE